MAAPLPFEEGNDIRTFPIKWKNNVFPRIVKKDDKGIHHARGSMLEEKRGKRIRAKRSMAKTRQGFLDFIAMKLPLNTIMKSVIARRRRKGGTRGGNKGCEVIQGLDF